MTAPPTSPTSLPLVTLTLADEEASAQRASSGPALTSEGGSSSDCCSDPNCPKVFYANYFRKFAAADPRKCSSDRIAQFAPIFRLPTELLSNILKRASEGLSWEDNRRNRWRLSHICSGLRQVAFATPDLWNYIASHHPLEESHFVANQGRGGLAVFVHSNVHLSEQAYKVFLMIALPHRQRWVAFASGNHAKNEVLLAKTAELTLPNMVYLSYSCDDGWLPTDPVFFRTWNLPQLAIFEGFNFIPRVAFPPTVTIVKLVFSLVTLTRSDIRTMMIALDASESLQYLTLVFNEVSPDGGEFEQETQGVLTFSKLRSLTIQSCLVNDAAIVFYLMSLLYIKNLETLMLAMDDTDAVYHTAAFQVMHLLKRSPRFPGLKNLHLSIKVVGDTEKYFHRMPIRDRVDPDDIFAPEDAVLPQNMIEQPIPLQRLEAREEEDEEEGEGGEVAEGAPRVELDEEALRQIPAAQYNGFLLPPWLNNASAVVPMIAQLEVLENLTIEMRGYQPFGVPPEDPDNDMEGWEKLPNTLKSITFLRCQEMTDESLGKMLRALSRHPCWPAFQVIKISECRNVKRKPKAVLGVDKKLRRPNIEYEPYDPENDEGDELVDSDSDDSDNEDYDSEKDVGECTESKYGCDNCNPEPVLAALANR